MNQRQALHEWSLVESFTTIDSFRIQYQPQKSMIVSGGLIYDGMLI
jgi:hypothetical protein